MNDLIIIINLFLGLRSKTDEKSTNLSQMAEFLSFRENYDLFLRHSYNQNLSNGCFIKR